MLARLDRALGFPALDGILLRRASLVFAVLLVLLAVIGLPALAALLFLATPSVTRLAAAATAAAAAAAAPVFLTRLAGVALDVFEPEPPDFHHPLFRHPNCLAAPHAIAGSKYSTNKIHKTMAQDMAAVLSGQRPQFLVNPEIYDA